MFIITLSTLMILSIVSCTEYGHDSYEHDPGYAHHSIQHYVPSYSYGHHDYGKSHHDYDPYKKSHHLDLYHHPSPHSYHSSYHHEPEHHGYHHLSHYPSYHHSYHHKPYGYKTGYAHHSSDSYSYGNKKSHTYYKYYKK